MIGVLREEPGRGGRRRCHNRRWLTFHAWWRSSFRRKVDFEMRVDGAAAAPGPWVVTHIASCRKR